MIKSGLKKDRNKEIKMKYIDVNTNNETETLALEDYEVYTLNFKLGQFEMEVQWQMKQKN